VQYQSRENRLILAADKVGARPHYFWFDDRWIVFSTSMGILERCTAVPKVVSLRGLFEYLTLGYSLSDRTPYRDIAVLRGGELLTACGAELKRSPYFRWDELPIRDDDPVTRLKDIYNLCVSAVERRAWRSPDCLSLLSGGLDSRLIVGALLTLGKHVTALNFAPEGYPSQDEAYAKAVARELGIRLLSIPMPLSGWTWGNLTKQALSALQGSGACPPKLVFSGDGGSVGLGAVYLNEQVVSDIRAGKASSVVEEYVSNNVTISARFVPRCLLVAARAAIGANISTELQASNVEPGRQWHLFLMNNDQHRHLHEWYENVEEHGVEYALPFFDGQFLEYILSSPLDPFLGHRLYHDLLALFPASLTRAAWQTYPGHLPCPIAPEENSMSQFTRRGKQYHLREGRP
jgi:hypothetical protein